jgi:polyamine oxidase
MRPSSVIVALLAVVLFAAQNASLAGANGPRVIIVGAGMSGKGS